MAMLSIDGTDLPAPVNFSAPNMDIDSQDSNRNELGYFQRDRIRQGVYKIDKLRFEKINSSQLALIKAAIKPSKFQFTFPSEIGKITKTMYAGDRDVEMISYNEDYNKILWNISFSVIEY